VNKAEPKSLNPPSTKSSKKSRKQHNSNLSLSTIAEESQSHISNSYADSYSSSSYDEEDHQPPSSLQSSLNGGTSVFLEPHITVESSNDAGNGVTKVTAMAKFKLELHTPNGGSSISSSENGGGSGGNGGSSRPSSRSRSRRSSSGSASTVPSVDPLRSSGDSSLASSLSSDGGFSEK
jgi:hypothetical protein